MYQRGKETCGADRRKEAGGRPGRLKKGAVLAAAVSLAAASLAGCAGSGASEAGANGSAAASGTQAGADGAVEVLMWHSMSGNTQKALEKVIAGFNDSQSQFHVTAEAQGDYDESISKFLNMAGGKGSPAIIQIGEQNLQAMIDSELIDSVSDLIAEYGYDDSSLLPQAVNFYTVDGTMYAMPFNCSSPVLYYNVDALKAAGYDEAPGTFEGILEAAPKISAANEGMKAFSKPVYGYALDQMVTNMGGLVVNNDNGRSGRATETAYGEQVSEIFGWLKSLIDAGEFVNYGTNSDNVITGFNQGDISMFITTSAYAAQIVDGAPFEVGVSALPVPEGTEPQGVYAGGGALCMSKGISDDVREGVMEFFEYAASPEVQAVWAGDTGYFPINTESYETDTMKQIYAEKPQLRVAADQLLNSRETAATAGPLLSQLSQLRNDLQAAEEMVFNGGDPEEAIAQAEESTNRQIEAANKSAGY